MPSLIWSPRAQADLVRLHGFLAQHDRRAARRAIAAIRSGLRPIADYPEAGRQAEGMHPAFRDWWIAFGSSGYLVRYRWDGSHILVLAVRHGRELGY